MAFEPGGYADKLGNRYEGWWIARQMLLLLSERLTSIALESVGDDETGVDLWITRLDGTREAHAGKKGVRSLFLPHPGSSPILVAGNIGN